MTGFPDRFFVDFPFRGSRTYIHSTSIVNHFLNGLGPCDEFEIMLRHWMTSRVVFTVLQEGQLPGGAGHVRVMRDGRTRLWQMDEDPAFPATERDVYDEAALPVTLDVAMRNAQVGACEGSTYCDRLIAANKKLIEASLSPGVKLIAAKIRLDIPVDDTTPIEMTLTGNVGTRIFKTAIRENGRNVGEVIFYGQ